MEEIGDKDIAKLNELLQHAAEFIAYFELAENKMWEWWDQYSSKAEIENREKQKQFEQFSIILKAFEELLHPQRLEIISASFDQSSHKMGHYLSTLEKISENFLNQYAAQKLDFLKRLQDQEQQLDKSLALTLQQIDNQHTHAQNNFLEKIKTNLYEEVEKLTHNYFAKARKYLLKFQWRTLTLTLCTSILCTFLLGLYLNNEFPWEIHQRARNEREAGKILISAWPGLSQIEKVKILHQGQSYKSKKS